MKDIHINIITQYTTNTPFACAIALALAFAFGAK